MFRSYKACRAGRELRPTMAARALLTWWRRGAYEVHLSSVAARLCVVTLVLGIALADSSLCAAATCPKVGASVTVSDHDYIWPATPQTFDVLMGATAPVQGHLTILAVGSVLGGTAAIVPVPEATDSGYQEILFTPAASPSPNPAPPCAGSFGSFTYTAQDSQGDVSNTGQVCLYPTACPTCTGSGAVVVTANCQGNDCYFSATPSTLINWVTFTWNFGDGSSESGDGRNVGHLYSNLPSTGCEPFNVTASAYYSDGSHTDGSLNICVANVVPLDKWTGSDAGGLLFSATVNASNLPWTSTTYAFDWGDGTPQAGLTIGDGDLSNLGMTHLFATPGLYHTTLWVNQNPQNPQQPCSASNAYCTPFAEEISIHNNPPSPDFVGASATNDLNWSFAPTGYIDEHPESCNPFFWDFGDGTYLSNGSAEPAGHAYAQRGTYLVTLSVTDALGAVGTATHAIDAAPIVAQFTFACSNVQPSCSLSPTATESGGTVQTFHFDFGDSTSADVPTGTSPVVHVFPGIGPYKVTLTALDLPYSSAPVTQVVTVNIVANDIGLAYFTIPPCRLYDSRQTTNMTANAPLTVLAAGKCGIPSTARVVAANLTVLAPAAPGYLQYGSANAVTALASYMEYQYIDNRNVQAFLKLDATGSGGFVSTTATNGLLVDVYGYYDSPNSAPPANAVGPYGYDTSGPSRWFNTWDASILAPGCGTYPPTVGAAASPGQRADFGGLRGASPCGIVVPSHAHAAQLTLSLRSPSNAESFSLFPSGSSDDGTTCLSVAASAFRTCTQAVRLGRTASDVSTAGQGASQTAIQYWLGIEGYYSQLGRQLFHPIPACRLLSNAVLTDTGVWNNTPVSLPVAGHCGVPSDGSAQFVAATVHVVNPSGEGEFWLGSQSVTTPFPVSFEATGVTQISGTAIVPVTQGNLQAGAFFRTPPFSGSLTFSIDVVGYFAPNTGGPLVSTGDQALFISQSLPTTMAAGGVYSVAVTMANLGSTTWTAGGSYRLGSSNPYNNSTWGLGRVYLANGDSIAPGQQKTFTFSVTAPWTAGNYNFQWQMVHEGVAWIGDPSDNVVVSVTAPSAEFGAKCINYWTPSGSVPKGSQLQLYVTMENTGWASWTPGNFRLGSQDPSGNSYWGYTVVDLALGDVITTGQQKTFQFTTQAPVVPGSWYTFQWQMFVPGGPWLGDICGSASAITVSADDSPVVSGDDSPADEPAAAPDGQSPDAETGRELELPVDSGEPPAAPPKPTTETDEPPPTSSPAGRRPDISDLRRHS